MRLYISLWNKFRIMQNFLEQLSDKILNAIYSIENYGVPRETIKILMPSYINNLICRENAKMIFSEQEKQSLLAVSELRSSEFYGIRIEDAIDNRISVGTTEGPLRHISPIIIETNH